MTATKKLELVCVIDRSGSMTACQQEAQAGLNTFIAEQKRVGPGKVTLHQFDNVYETVWERQSLAGAPEYKLEPRGMTALLDAVGRTITSMNPKPDRQVVVLVVTDGHENASQEFTRDQVRKLVTERQDAGWSFVFIGAGVDAFAEAGSIGISAGSTVSATNSAAGYTSSYSSVSDSVTRSRATGKPVELTEEERKKVK